MSEKIIDLTNKRFGKWLVLGFSHLSDKKQAFWRCLCDCGNSKIVVGTSLRNGKSNSCGCNRYPSNKLEPRVSAFNELYGSYKHKAQLRNYVFEITSDEFYSLTQQNCYYCNSIPMQITGKSYYNGKFIYNGIDRLDNSIGYIKSNVVPCCGKCNKAKSTMGYDEFILWITAVYNNRVE